MTELEGKGLKFYLRHVGVVASDEDFEAWYMQRHLGGRVWFKVCHFCRSRAGSTRGEIDDSGDFWHSSVRCILPSWMCLTTGRADQVQRLLDSLASHHPDRGAHHFAHWCAGLRVMDIEPKSGTGGVRTRS